MYTNRSQSLKSLFVDRRRSQYEDFWALRDVALEIPEGKTFGLLGNNGSGKSTLLKCIAKILTPNQGTITSRGRMAAMLEVGSGFHPELTGRENVYLNGSILGMSRHEVDRKFDDIVDFAGIGTFIDQPVKNYSSGMYVRLGFAVSIHVEPEILLVDEILAVGDAEFQERCMGKFADFRREGRTVVVVSHGLEQMRSFCDEAAWLSHGELKGTGPVSEVIEQYSEAAHLAKPVEGGGARIGSGDAQITRMEWLHPDGRDARTCRTGDEIRIRLHYTASETIERPVFGVSVQTLDDRLIWGHHAQDSDYVPQSIEPGDGSIDVVIPSLPLRPDTYTLSASIQGPGTSHLIDGYLRGLTFTVVPTGRTESGGYVVFGSHFERLTPPRPMVTSPRNDVVDATK
ncbi:ABC transporter ATP-binding protein [Oerskovia sp. Sa2CUA9]|uniref:ABC transporter ATP-binding protein n=2 Tax=Cellulomonadaceae TaxID=85016 RepID=A0ABR8TU29_9CELL|nr:ABC transporter ATP-binding protein [Oerskovia merdavium]